ncbi:unnamed protein product [Rotaria socialis]|uniref:Globin-sensor domain-containing protein n=1 Tax=Rotaria socialis TaxID=392032 RepID=A0A819AVI1_9BILA|nr:unnamed protein product [Rotaria socialis]CAF3265852.1 unnamed protein product [Rotaria socialis]CAF3659202.1 unnamed protein product [Rotaria socialis]CAF3783055.1 unnamed protein product [Rotaria socialis]CAF3783613.1 unnamed protein product [Rotaria socialis]
MTEHIDGKRLHEDLRYRFEYIAKFINFTSDDVKALNAFATTALPLVPVIVDAVYRKLFQFDITKEFFVLRNDGFDGRLKKDEVLTLDSAQMAYRRDMLSDYLKRLLLQHEWADDFLQYLSRIGRLHGSKTGQGSINVDYIHMNATLCYVETLLIDSVWHTENLDNKAKKEILIAINKAFRIQNDLLLLHYLESSKESDASTRHTAKKCVCS